MDVGLLDHAIELIEKANADLQPELLSASDVRALIALYARVERLAAFGVAALARKLDDASAVARTTGTSMGRARTIVTTGKTMATSPQLGSALAHGDISLDQAAAIAPAVEAAPSAAADLVATATSEPFHVLRECARRVKLDAERHEGLAERQRAARCARSHPDDLGMIHVHVAWEPHVGTPIVNRAEAEAQRLARKAKADGRPEPFERHLADAYAALLADRGAGRARRPEMVVLVSHEVARRGWTDVRDDERCDIPGVGPVSPDIARKIAQDAFLTGVFFDGKDLRHLRRWTRNIPVGVRVALELGEPPRFDGVRCADCGNRFRTENDHVEPHVARGPASTDNLEPRCRRCHRAKTDRDRRAGRLRPPPDP